jgi:PleD family two-component response regulator
VRGEIQTIMAAISNLKRRRESVATNLHAPAQKKHFDARVLVVEDHDDTRLMLRTMLEWRGVSVVEAADGEAAVSMTETCRPDLILMDGSLPSLDGLTATRCIRQLDGAREVPIIVRHLGGLKPSPLGDGFSMCAVPRRSCKMRRP